MIDISLRITDASGNFLFETRTFLEIGNAPGLHYVLSCGKVGALTVTLPPDYNHLLVKDARIHVMRSVNGAPAQREGESCFLIRRWDYADDYTIVTALHANHIFWRRYAMWGWYTRKSETDGVSTADDEIKQQLWDDNFAANAGAGGSGRNAGSNYTQADISAYVPRQAQIGAAVQINKNWYWMNCGDVVLDFCDASTLAGVYLTAEIVAPTEPTLEMRTYTGQRGQDRRFSSGSGLIFSSRFGNLANAILTNDATNEVTIAIAGGPRRDSGYDVFASADPARMGESPLNRIEGFVDDASGTNTTTTAYQDDADAALRAGRPVIRAQGDLVDTDRCIRGVHYDFGDLLTVEVRGIQYDMRLDLLDVTLSGGVETTRAAFFYNG